MSPDIKWLGEFAGFLPNGIIFANSAGEILFSNDLSATMLGINPLDMVIQGLAAIPEEYGFTKAISASNEDGIVKNTWELNMGKSCYVVTVIGGGIKLFDEASQLFIITESTVKKGQVELGRGLFSEMVPLLRSPLTSIKTALAMLASNKYIEMPESAREIVSLGNSEAERMNALLGDLSDVLMLEGRQAEANFYYESVDIQKEIDELIRETLKSPLGLGREITFNRFEEGGPLIIKADAEKLRMALGQLLNNALSYSSVDAPVTVGITLKIEKDEIEVTIQDRGQGIHPDDLGSLYNKFHKSKHGHSTGDGLGLFLAKSYLELMGARLNIESEWKVGTRAKVIFPL